MISSITSLNIYPSISNKRAVFLKWILYRVDYDSDILNNYECESRSEGAAFQSKVVRFRLQTVCGHDRQYD